MSSLTTLATGTSLAKPVTCAAADALTSASVSLSRLTNAGRKSFSERSLPSSSLSGQIFCATM